MNKFKVYQRKSTTGNISKKKLRKANEDTLDKVENLSCKDLNRLNFLEIASNVHSKVESNYEKDIKMKTEENHNNKESVCDRSNSTKNIFLHEKSLLTNKRRYDIRTVSLSLSNNKSFIKPFASIGHRYSSSIEISPSKIAKVDSCKASKKELFFDLVSNSIKNLSQRKTHFLNIGVKKSLIEEIKKPSEILRRRSLSIGKLKARDALIASDNFMDSIKNLISNLSHQKDEATDIFKRDFNVSLQSFYSDIIENVILPQTISGFFKVP